MKTYVLTLLLLVFCIACIWAVRCDENKKAEIAFNAGCPEFNSGEIPGCLIETKERPIGKLVPENRRILCVLDISFIGQADCDKCHVVEWKARD